MVQVDFAVTFEFPRFWEFDAIAAVRIAPGTAAAEADAAVVEDVAVRSYQRCVQQFVAGLASYFQSDA